MIKPPSRLLRGTLLRAVPLALAAACFPAVALADDVAPTPPGTVVARDDFSTTTSLNGEFHTRTFSDPVNFQNSNGSWTPVNRTLTGEADGAVHPKDVDGDAAIPSTLTDPVRLEHDGRHISFQLLGADGDRETQGSTASFDDAVPNADVSYRSLADGLKESIVLQSKTTRRVYNYAVTGGDDLQATISSDGDLVLTDAAGDEKFRVSAPLAWDSAAEPSYSNKLDLSVTKQSAGHWTLTMRPDAAWLDDPARVYPVTLDPDVYWLNDGSGAERFHGANQDCHMQSSDLANNSYCSSLTLSIGYYRRSYRANLRFDLAAAIPAYANITNAQLAMFLPGTTTHAAVNSRVHTLTSDWDNTATWNNRKVGTTNTPWTTPGGDVSPAANLTGTVNPSVGNGNYWYYWNTPLDAVNGWVKGTLPNYGLQVSTDTEDGPTGAYSFVSTDGNQANWPALDVTWLPDTTAPNPITNLRLGAYNGTGAATFVWDDPTDPDLANGTPGSGIASVQVTATVNGVARAATAVTGSAYDVTGVSPGNHVQLSVHVTDRAGNARDGSIDIPQLASISDDPQLDAAAVNAYISEYPGTTQAAASAWIATQNAVMSSSQGDPVGRLQTAATTAGYGGAYFDNSAKQFVVKLTTAANTSAVNSVLASMPASTRVDSAPYSADTLGNAQAAMEDDLVDLLNASKVSFNGSEQLSQIEVDIASTDSAAEKARIRAVNTHGVQTNFVEVDPATMAYDPSSCRWPYCDAPLRGGVAIYNDGGWNCTLGFVVRQNDSTKPRVGITAGHCIDEVGSHWWTLPSSGQKTDKFTVGYDGRSRNGGSAGDWGTINLDSGLYTYSDIFVNKSSQTTLNEYYPIRRASQNVENTMVCETGGVAGTQCGKVLSRRATITRSDGVVLRGQAQAKFCLKEGDSGGPVYKAGVAYGVNASVQHTGIFGQNCPKSAYTGAVTVEAGADVSFTP